MSTQKWSDDDLDDFFRKSAEESDPPYDPTAWQGLKVRLNDRDRTRLLKWTTPLLLLLLLLGGIAWYTSNPAGIPKPTPAINNPSEIAATTKTNRVAVNERSTDRESSTATGTGPAVTSAIQSTDPQLIKRPQPDETGGPDTNLATDFRNRKKVSDSPAVNPLTDQQPARTEQTGSPANRLPDEPAFAGDNNPPAPDRVVSVAKTHTTRLAIHTRARQTNGKDTKQIRPRAGMGQHSLVAGGPVDPPNGTARQDAKTGGLGRHRSVMSGSDTTTDPAGPGLPDSGTRIGDTTLVPGRETPGPDEQSTDRFLWLTPDALAFRATKWSAPLVSIPEPVWQNSTHSIQRPARVRLSGLSIQAVLAPDLSTIGLHNFDRPGSNLGILLQYQLSKRFSVQTGALWSTKVYTSLASEYVWPANGGMTVWPESISGRCTMFDIPLNLRYDVLLRPGGAGRGPVRWFVSGGVTSYFIKREMYNYNYAWPNDPAIKYRNWNINKGSSIGLSNLNISLGYERPVGRRLSWQIEPFVKIPLQPIGYFKVRLVSTGAFLSLRYRL